MWQSMRLLTAGSSVRAGLEEPKTRACHKDMLLFLFCVRLNKRHCVETAAQLLTEPKATAAGGGGREIEDAQKPGDAGGNDRDC